MKNMSRRGILSFLGAAPAAALPTVVAASTQPPPSELDAMSFEECRFLWHEHLSLARKCMNAAAKEGIVKKSESLALESHRHMKRYVEIYHFAVRKFGDMLPRSGHGEIQ